MPGVGCNSLPRPPFMTPSVCKSTRERIGTQAQVAAMLGVHRVTVAKWETGALPVPRMASIALASLSKGAKSR
jgi:DNA-binding transcriptional regulator YiaG